MHFSLRFKIFAFILPLAILICTCCHVEGLSSEPDSHWILAGFPFIFYETCGTSAAIDIHLPPLLLNFSCFLLIAAGTVFSVSRIFRKKSISRSRMISFSMVIWGLALGFGFFWALSYLLLPDWHWSFSADHYREGSAHFQFIPLKFFSGIFK